MVCTSPSLTVECLDEEEDTSAIASGLEERKPLSRRRHSSFHPHPRRSSSDYAMEGEEGLLIKVSQSQISSRVYANVFVPKGRYIPFRARKTSRFPGELRKPQFRFQHFEGLCDATSCEGKMLASLWRSSRCWQTTSQGHG